MSLQSCLVKTKNFVKESKLDRKVSKDQIDSFARRLEAMGADALTPADFAAKAKDLVENTLMREMKAAQAEKLMTIAKREAALKNLVNNVEKWRKAGVEDSKVGKTLKALPVEAFRAWQEGGSILPGEGTNLDIDQMTKSNRDYLRDIWNEGVKGVKDLAQAGVIDKETFIEKYALDTNGQLGKSGSEAALSYAKGLKAVQDAILKLKQAYNPKLEAATEYLWKQFHEPDRILADPSPEGKQAWLDQAMKTYGKKSFPELSMEEKAKVFLKGYDKIADGTWGSVTEDGVRRGRGSVTERMSHERQWIPESAELAYNYQSKYGPKTIAEGMDRVLDAAARDVAILAKAGPNAEAMRNGLYERFLSQLSGDDAKALEAAKPQLDKSWRGVTGARNEAATGLVGKITQGVMTAQYLAKTGSSLFHVITDIPMAASLLRNSDGRSIFQNSAELALEVAKAFKDSDYKAARLSDAGMFMDATHAAMMSELGAPGEDNGAFAGRMLQKIGVLNLLNRWHGAMKSGEAAILMKRLGDVSETPFAELPPRWKQSLQRYGFTPNSWDIARLGREEILGRQVISPDAIRALPDEAIENYLRKDGHVTGESVSDQMLNFGRQDLAMKLSVMLREHATLSAAEMTSRQRNFLWGDTTINEGWGAIRRLVTQFKGASVVSYDTYRRGYFSGENMRGDMAGVAQQIIMTTLVATMGDQLHQLSQGKTPEDPLEPGYAFKMFAKSGVGGIYGGVLANNLSQHGWKNKAYNLATGFAGPTISTALDTAGVVSEGLSELAGGPKDRTLGNKAVSLGAGMIPGGGTFYIKPVLDYYLINQLHQFMGPGFLGALERRTNQTPGLLEPHQRYLFARPTGRNFFE